jgi:hypothetical protein
MARWTRGPNSPVIGKIGEVVGSSYKGKLYAKATPVRKKKGTTPKQDAQHMRFATINRLMAPFRKLLNITFLNGDPLTTGVNNATSHNFKLVLTGEYPDITVDYSKLVVAKGPLHAADTASVTRTDTLLKFSWTSTFEAGSDEEKDLAVLVVYCPELKKCRFNIGPVNRAAGEATIDASTYKGREVHTWLAFVSEDQTLASDSVYTGMENLLPSQN